MFAETEGPILASDRISLEQNLADLDTVHRESRQPAYEREAIGARTHRSFLEAPPTLQFLSREWEILI